MSVPPGLPIQTPALAVSAVVKAGPAVVSGGE
jgi:hypothetical protein